MDFYSHINMQKKTERRRPKMRNISIIFINTQQNNIRYDKSQKMRKKKQKINFSLFQYWPWNCFLTTLCSTARRLKENRKKNQNCYCLRFHSAVLCRETFLILTWQILSNFLHACSPNLLQFHHSQKIFRDIFLLYFCMWKEAIEIIEMPF